MIDLIQLMLFFAGVALVVVGLWIINPAVCLIVSGLGLMAGTINGMVQNRKYPQ